MTPAILDLDAVEERGYLILRYRLHNADNEPLYLRAFLRDYYNMTGDERLHRGHELTPEIAYVCYRDAAALFFQGRVPDPPNVRFDAPRVPMAARIEAGEQFSAAIRAALPLVEWHAYEEPRSHPAEPVPIHRARLKLEYVPSETARSVQPHPTYHGLYRLGGLPSFVEAEADLHAPCTLLRRTDAFLRFD
jgi:hypothetical protein